MPRTSEEETRANIDVELADCGWLVRDSKSTEFPKLLDELHEAHAA